MHFYVEYTLIFLDPNFLCYINKLTNIVLNTNEINDKRMHFQFQYTLISLKT